MSSNPGPGSGEGRPSEAEYARHAGHADLLRERIDGRVGQ